jgi:predicted flap endonuclease-1-like 5' DNA nuclease
MKIVDIEGVGKTYADKLERAGVETVERLLARAAAKKERVKLAADTGINEALILEWVNHADLMRINGVGSEYSDLLEAAGVDSCAELAQRRADNLALKMNQLNQQKKLVRRTPTEAEVLRWIDEARGLPKVVTH